MYFSTENSTENLAYLDILRNTKGYEVFKADFEQMLRSNTAQAVEMLNDSRLKFASLYLLIPEIHTFNLYSALSQRNIRALRVCARVLENEVLTLSLAPFATQSNGSNGDEKDKEKSTLNWMLSSGYYEDGLNDEFDELLDGVVALLLIELGDKTALPIAAKLIFIRNRKGSFNHDLIWSFFQLHEVESLKLIAENLKSPDPRDAKLAAELLHFRADENIAENSQKHKVYLQWLKENYDYLYFTGENYQQTSSPQVCSVDLDAKYLGKSISAHSRQMLSPLTQGEKQRLEEFRRMDAAQQVHLSNYSQKILNQHRGLWSRWNSYPVSRQMDIAQNGIGGARWL